MTDLHETLAQLLAGALPPEQAAALHDRIAEDPAVRAAWVDVLRLELDLLTLPLDAAPPAAAPPARRWPVWGLAALALLACGALLSQSHDVLSPGEPMDFKNTLLSAGAGSAVTIAVMSGFAEVDVDGETRTVSSGESLSVTIEPPPRSAPAAREPAPASTSAAGSGGQDWEAEARRLSIENAMLQGQLAQLGGTVAEWPASVSEAFRAEAVADFFELAVADSEDMDLLQIDCSEYPCIVMVEYTEGTEANTSVTQPLLDAFSEATDGELAPYVYLFGMGEQPIVGISLGASSVDPNESRVDVRIEDLVDTLMPQEP